MQEKWHLQRSLKASLLGYSVLDLVEHAQNLVFGTWNPRHLKTPHVRRLLSSFEEDGLDRFDERSVIPLVLKKSLVDSSSLTQDLSDVSKLPGLKFTNQSKDSFPIRCAGGRHRFKALSLYLDDVENKKRAVETKRQAISERSEEVLTDEDVQYFNKDSVQELQHYGGILKYGGQWLVAVYDESECFLFCFLLLIQMHC